MLFVKYFGSTVQVNSRWDPPPPHHHHHWTEFLVFTMLAGVPFPIASAALPFPSSSIIYVAIARICPEIHTRQSFNFLLPHRPLRLADEPESCQSARPRCRSATLTSVPLSVAGQQGSWGCRLLFRTAEADMGEEVSNGIGRLGLIDFSSHILLRPNVGYMSSTSAYISYWLDWLEKIVREGYLLQILIELAVCTHVSKEFPSFHKGTN